jgi:hypothetical protein
LKRSHFNCNSSARSVELTTEQVPYKSAVFPLIRNWKKLPKDLRMNVMRRNDVSQITNAGHTKNTLQRVLFVYFFPGSLPYEVKEG